METTLPHGAFRQMRLQLVGDASAALFVLTLVTAVSVYKPWGMTPYGLRKEREVTVIWRPRRTRINFSGRYVLFGITLFGLIILLIHVAGFGLHGH
jgi:hypothetical protein